MRVSSRGQVDAFIVMDILAKARQLESEGRSIIHLEIGQPGTPAPKAARSALAAALDGDVLGYTVARGLQPLRAAIAQLYQRWYGLEINPDRVVVTTGSSAAFLLAFSALFDNGDRVGLVAPGYPSYRQILRALGLNAVELPTHARNRYAPSVADISGRDLQGLLLASPGNPTGTLLSRADLGALITSAQDQNCSFISDEIYHGLTYTQAAVSALEISDDVYVVNSFSKYFSMTGWRIGWMIVPENHIRTVERLAQNLFICPPHASQIAALAALDCTDELEKNRETYAKSRAIMLEALPKAGFTKIAPPDGAFYVYADISDISDNSVAFVEELLLEAGIAIAPGIDFDPQRGLSTVRFSYAGHTSDVAEGMKRLLAYMSQRKAAS